MQENKKISKRVRKLLTLVVIGAILIEAGMRFSFDESIVQWAQRLLVDITEQTDIYDNIGSDG